MHRSLWGVKLKNVYGVIMENINTGKTFELFFDDPELMEIHIKVYDKKNYKIKEYLHEQQSLMFDIRD